jgi:hypothetical protein
MKKEKKIVREEKGKFAKGGSANPTGRHSVISSERRMFGVWSKFQVAYILIRACSMTLGELTEQLERKDITMLEALVLKELKKGYENNSYWPVINLLDRLWPYQEKPWGDELDKAMAISNDISPQQQLENLKGIMIKLEDEIKKQAAIETSAVRARTGYTEDQAKVWVENDKDFGK